MAMSEPPFGFGMPQEPGDDPERDRGGAGGSGSGGSGSGGSGSGGSGSGGSGSGGSGSGGSQGPLGPGGPFGLGGPFGDPQQLAETLRQVADMMAYQGGPVNWDLAKNTA